MHCHISSHICQQRSNHCCAYCNKGQQEQKNKEIQSAQPKHRCTVGSAGGRGESRETGARSNSIRSKGGQRPEVQPRGEKLEGTAQIKTFGGIYLGEPCAVYVRREWPQKQVLQLGGRTGTELPGPSLSPPGDTAPGQALCSQNCPVALWTQFIPWMGLAN